jgi:hypothetical protein
MDLREPLCVLRDSVVRILVSMGHSLAHFEVVQLLKCVGPTGLSIIDCDDFPALTDRATTLRSYGANS